MHPFRVRHASATCKRALCAALVGLAHLHAHAGDDDIVTDRPSFAESSKVVGQKRFQLETGFQLDRDRTPTTRERTLSMPTLLRYGVARDLELRLETDGRTVQRETGRATGEHQTIAGYADTELGLKWHVRDGEGALPSVGVLAHAELPTGSRGLKGEGVRPSLRVAAEWDLPGELSLGLMPGVALDRNDTGRRYAYGMFAAVLGKSFSERLGGFAELALPQAARAADGGTKAIFDTGVTWLLSRDCQVDTMLVRGLNRNVPDWSWTVGLSFRR